MGHDGSPRRRRQAERSASTRRALLDSGRALFAERGFAGTAREDIVRQAGVTRGALYHHFAGKEELFRAVFEEMEREVADRVMVAPPPAATRTISWCGAVKRSSTSPPTPRCSASS